MQAALEAHFSRKPRLTPPLKRWEEDLPESQKEQAVPGQLIRVTEINKIWMEIPRYENIMWGGAWVGFISTLIPAFIAFYMSVNLIFLPGFHYSDIYDLFFLMTLWIGGLLILSICFFNLKMALLVPRDQPIRFNRKRQKVYLFDYQRKWNPWAKWPATVKVFDWADIHGEISYEVDRYDQGFRLYCAVCKPGTTEVIERFILSRALSHPEPQRRLWSHCCQYMQHKPVVADPLYPGRPDSWKPRKSMHWPEEIDRESTTAPEA
ncbi:hypothetical protein CYR32_19420 [Chimaeribacter coloradensis]|uniref:DUF6708 domain-containing protein n=1 Tax=Chimaeribacter coloradensis TaxID=2060068 RepID=A0A2N5DTW5_9GAMM|nr:hypothetical protein CYR32_19420 [Chimaeribacter coloradensis]